MRVHGDPEQARRALLQRLTAIDPNMGEVMTMRTLARMETYFLQIAFWLTLVLGGLALVLTLSGLFSVLSYLVEQRSEGDRRAHGARRDARETSQGWCSHNPYARSASASSPAAALAAGLAIVLMSTPAAAQIGGVVHVFDPVAYAASLACIVTACALAALIPALRAARIDPMTTLRQE